MKVITFRMQAVDLAGLACATLDMGRPVHAGQRLEVGLVLAGSIALDVAAAGLGTVAEGPGRSVSVIGGL